MRQGTGGNGKGKRNRKTALAVIMIAALVGFLTAGGGFLYYYWEYQRSRQEYTEIARIGTAPSQRTDLYGPEEGGEGTGQEYVLLEVDFAALQAVNPQVTAWLDIPGTGISYPVVQGTDNSYYLHHTVKKTYNFAGTIFMDAGCAPYPTADGNLVLYGHNMKNGTMFGLLKRYRDRAYYEEHPVFYLYLADGSVYRCPITGGFDIPAVPQSLPLTFAAPEEKEAYLQKTQDMLWYAAGESPGPDDPLITLVTCVGNQREMRLALQGRAELVEAGE